MAERADNDCSVQVQNQLSFTLYWALDSQYSIVQR